jgi:hypothetical protein
MTFQHTCTACGAVNHITLKQEETGLGTTFTAVVSPDVKQPTWTPSFPDEAAEHKMRWPEVVKL